MMKFGRTLRATPYILLIVLLCCVGLVRAEYAVAANQVSYVGSPPPPVDGALLPQTPTTLDAIFDRESLLFTFQNSCFAAAANGDASITIDASQRTIFVNFDESTATLFPICPAVYLPTSTMQLELDPLPAGTWTLEIDEMLTIFPSSIPPRTIVFDVVPVGGSVPAGGSFYYVTLLVGMILTVLLLERAKTRAICGMFGRRTR